MTKIIGHAAIEYAIENGLNLNKFADPTEGERLGLSIAEARSIAQEDPDLIWVAARVLPPLHEIIADAREQRIIRLLDSFDNLIDARIQLDKCDPDYSWRSREDVRLATLQLAEVLQEVLP